MRPAVASAPISGVIGQKPNSPAIRSASRSRGSAREADRRVRPLERAEVRPVGLVVLPRPFTAPEPALVGERAVVLHRPQNNLERLAHHLAVLTGLPSTRNIRRSPFTLPAATPRLKRPRERMVEDGGAVGDLRGVVERQEEPAGPEADLVASGGAPGRSRDRARVGLPGRDVVFADPRLLVAELVPPAHHLEVPRVPSARLRSGGWEGMANSPIRIDTSSTVTRRRAGGRPAPPPVPCYE